MTPIDRFVPAADPAAAWDAWAAYLAPIFHTTPVPETQVDGGVGMWNCHLDALLVGDMSAPAQNAVRSRRRAAEQGVDHVLIQFYRSGTGRARTERGERDIHPHDFVIYDLAQLIEITAAPVTATTVLLPRALLGERAGAIEALHGRTFSALADASARLLASCLREIVALGGALPAAQAPGIAQATAKLVCAALPGGAGDGPTTGRGASVAVRAFIQEHLGTRNLGPAMICDRFGLSRSSLYRQFETDDGVQNYIRNRRLAQAMRLLRQDADRPRISSVAYATGFSDEKSFSRAFKKRFGCLPREARTRQPAEPEAGSRLDAWIRHLDA